MKNLIQLISLSFRLVSHISIPQVICNTLWSLSIKGIAMWKLGKNGADSLELNEIYVFFLDLKVWSLIPNMHIEHK